MALCCKLLSRAASTTISSTTIKQLCTQEIVYSIYFNIRQCVFSPSQQAAFQVCHISQQTAALYQPSDRQSHSAHQRRHGHRSARPAGLGTRRIRTPRGPHSGRVHDKGPADARAVGAQPRVHGRRVRGEGDVGAVVQRRAGARDGDDLDRRLLALGQVQRGQHGGADVGEAGDAGARLVVDAVQRDVERRRGAAEAEVDVRQRGLVRRVPHDGAAGEGPEGAVGGAGFLADAGASVRIKNMYGV